MRLLPSRISSFMVVPPLYSVPLAFPLGGRWHGEAVTDEGQGQVKKTNKYRPSSVSLRSTASPKGEAKKESFPLFIVENSVENVEKPSFFFLRRLMWKTERFFHNFSHSKKRAITRVFAAFPQVFLLLLIILR